MIKFIKVIAIAGMGIVAAGAVGIDTLYPEDMTLAIRMVGAGALFTLLCLLMTIPSFRATLTGTGWKALLITPYLVGFISYWITKLLTKSARAAHCVYGVVSQCIGISQGIHMAGHFWKSIQIALCVKSIADTIKQTINWSEYTDEKASAKESREEFFKSVFV